jgi:CheY-like chemotaxis protein
MIFITNSNNKAFFDIINKSSIKYDFEKDVINFDESDDLKLILNKNIDALKNASIIYINALNDSVNTKKDSDNESSSFGINVLEWLRIKFNCLQPIVLISTSNSEEWLTHSPKDVLIVSPAVKYYKVNSEDLIYFLNNVTLYPPKGLVSIDVIKPFLKSKFDLFKFRHSEANTYGLKTLFDIQSLIKKPKELEKLIYPEQLEREIDNLKYYALDLLYPSASRKKRIDSYVIKVKEDLILKLSEINKKNDFTGYSSEDLIELKDAYEKDLVSVDDAIFQLKNFDQTEGIIEYEKEAEKIKSEISKIYERLATIEKELHLDSELDWSNAPNLKPIRVGVESKNVLLIDDQASLGWTLAYKTILKLKNIDVIEPSGKNDIENIIKEVDTKLKAKDYDIIFLDLMLFKDEITSVHIELSGIQVLKHLKKLYPHVPVLVTSASNKIWSFKEVINSGGYAYWMKEGIDSLFDFDNSLNNYNNLISTFNKIIKNDEFRILKKLGEFSKELSSVNFRAWWTNPNFKWNVDTVTHRAQHYEILNSINKSNINSLKRTFKNAVDIYRAIVIESLNQTKLSRSLKPLLDMVILELVKCIEIIHLYRKPRTSYNSINQNTICNARGDNTAVDLLKYRNNSAHYVYGNRVISLDKLDEFLNIIIPYLSSRNFEVDAVIQEEVIQRDRQNTQDLLMAVQENDRGLLESVIKENITKVKTETSEKSLEIASEKLEVIIEKTSDVIADTVINPTDKVSTKDLVIDLDQIEETPEITIKEEVNIERAKSVKTEDVEINKSNNETKYLEDALINEDLKKEETEVSENLVEVIIERSEVIAKSTAKTDKEETNFINQLPDEDLIKSHNVKVDKKDSKIEVLFKWVKKILGINK